MAVSCPMLTTSAKEVKCKVGSLRSGYIHACTYCPIRTGGSQPEKFRVSEKAK